MYRYYVTKRAPVAAWILDDEAPFQECSGSNAVADMLSGVPTKSVPLVAGAGYSSVFKRNAVGRFSCNLFKQGMEDRPFAVEAWVLPIRKTNVLSEVKNIALNPSYETGTAGTGQMGSSTATTTLDNTDAKSGVQSCSATITAVSGSYGRSHTLAAPYVNQSGVYSWGVWVKPSRTLTFRPYGELVRLDTGGYGGVSPTNSLTTAPANEWTLIKVENVNVTNVGGSLRFGALTGDHQVGDVIKWDGGIVVEGPTLPEFFDGDSVGAAWDGTPHYSSSTMLLSSSSQQILSHDGIEDGLSIDGNTVRFGTSYLTSGNAYCEYDLGEAKLAHVVGIHNSDANQLWVNGELVASVLLTDEQKADSYIATDEYLYCGSTVSSQEIAVNGVAFYPTLSGDNIMRNYEAGIGFIGQDRVAPQYGGTAFGLSGAAGSVFIEEDWLVKSDFETGLNDKVTISTDRILPSYENGLSVAGTWTVSVPLDALGDTSIYGVMTAWSGKSVAVDVSLDGTTWAPAESGRLVSIIPNTYDPTDKDLQIRVSFAGGLADDPAYLEGLSVTGYRDNTIENITARPVTASHPAVLRKDFEPNLYRDDNGISLDGGTLTIGPDTTTDPDVARTLELWVKPLSGGLTTNIVGTQYRNGVADATLPVGEWSLVHLVADADIVGDITVTGDIIIGQATLYPTALDAATVSDIWKSYTGSQTVRFSDTNTVGVSETATPVAIYAHDWAIDSAG